MKKINIYLIAIIITLGGFLFGYDTGVINGTQFYFSKFFELTGAIKGFIVSSALIGALFGALISGYLSNLLGRKISLSLSALLFVVSAWGSGLPDIVGDSITLLVTFRIIGGIAIGLASMNAPMYIAEIAPAEKRGNLVSFYQLAIVVGFFSVFLVTYFIGQGLTETQNINIGWRYMFWSELFPSVLFFISLFFVPESPRWLLLKGKEYRALEVLVKIHGQNIAEEEINQIRKSIHSSNESADKKKYSSTIIYVIVLGTILSSLQQFTGINAVLYYGADIFEQALGFGKEDILKQQILLAAVNLLFTFIAMFTVDKLGRKPLLIVGGFGMLIGFLMIGMTLYSSDYSSINSIGVASINNFEGIVCLFGILLFIGSFALSMGPVVWIILSEIFPNNIRSIAMSIAVAAQWFSNYFVSQTFPVIVESKINSLKIEGGYWNHSLPYFLFSAFIIVIIIFVWKFIPETKGKSLEEIENLWSEIEKMK